MVVGAYSKDPDAKRGRLFTKLIREISMSARLGGGAAESARGKPGRDGKTGDKSLLK